MSTNSSSVKISVLLPVPLDTTFDYAHASPLPKGTLVKVSFGARELYGITWDNHPSASYKTLKPLLKIYTGLTLPDVSIKFIDWVSEYTMSHKGQILKMAVPVADAYETEGKRALKQPSPPPPKAAQKPQLSLDQMVASEDVIKSLETEAFHTFLLEGVTGSGKTEVYFESIDWVLKKGGQALVMLPEIALSAQWLQRFEKRFGFPPALWHSDLGKRERKLTFRSIVEGGSPVIVGTRSSLFLPYPDLKLIVVDEEHDGSYKQEEGVIYNARDMAVVRARFSNATCVLASATPSLETEMNVASGKYRHIKLLDRYGDAEMPDVKLIDMRRIKRKSGEWLSQELRQSIRETLDKGEQAMLFLNRRGYAPMTLCQNCGDRLMCPHCSVSLVQHKYLDKLLCHHCGHTLSLPKQCVSCNVEGSYSAIGPGVERILEEVQNFFPDAKSAIMTSDHLSTSAKVSELVDKIQNHEVDILIGTQIMAKGHHFPLLTLVGIIDGDSALSGSDLRASEKSFQLLHQVAGRSGRESRRGQVLLQTHAPEHPVMQALARHNRAEFIALESDQRMIHGFPPFGRLAALIVSGKKPDEVEKTARLLASRFPLNDKAELLGPTPAPLSYLRGKNRWRLLLKTDKNFPPQPLIKHWLGNTKIPSTIRIQVDIDPYSFY
jgi:primosomal protein N' (replication factor Y)